VRRIAITPSVTLPAGWNLATALGGRTRRGDTVSWATDDYETLVDSPVIAGAFFRQWDPCKQRQLSAVADGPGC
jgi:predicted metalloprotease with PDZ domain